MILRTLAPTLLALTLAAACAPADELPGAFEDRGESVGVSASPLPITPAPACVDGDGDGFGRGCEAGDDCDDQDVTRAETCAPTCESPAEGCPCSPRDEPLPCDVDTQRELTRATCWLGQRTCIDAAWTRCIAYAPRFR